MDTDRAYAAVLAQLYAARRFGMKLELSRMRVCLDRMGSPEHRLGAVVHVGGTNGKGSTSAFVEAIARAAGRSVGVFSSPHLSRFSERVRIDGAPVDPSALVAASERVEAAVAGDAGDPLTFFERVTAMAIDVFAARELDLVVLEVGLGGRFDATNVVDAQVAVVTGVALDHQAQLGDTVQAIAGEKAGIFKPGRHAVIGASGEPEGVPWLIEGARSAGVAAITVVDAARIAALPQRLGLAGSFQRANAAAAVAAWEALAAAGQVTAGADVVAAGLAAATLPGRMETVARAPDVIVDGAHNPHAAAALARDLAATGSGRVITVIGISADKDPAGIVGPLAAISDVVIATAGRADRAAPAVVVADAAARAGVATEMVVPVGAAIDRARALAGPSDRIVVTGSLFVAGEAREHILGIEPDPYALTDPR